MSAPADIVYDLIADVPRMGEWSPETTCAVTEADRGRAFAFDVGKGETRWRYDLTPTSDGDCEVTESFEIVRTPGALGRLMTRLSTGVSWSEREADLVDGMQQTLQRLKTAAERA